MSIAEDTRERIIDAAERLFVAQGFGATSLRSITREAGANLAAIHYHFGSKEELIRAVFERFIKPINEQRLARLDALEAELGERAPEVEQLLEVFLAPAFTAWEEGETITEERLRLVARMYAERALLPDDLVVRLFEGVARRFLRAFGRALPELPREELFMRLHFAVGAMLHVANVWSDENFNRELGGLAGERATPPVLLAQLVPFLAAGFRQRSLAPPESRSEASS